MYWKRLGCNLMVKGKAYKPQKQIRMNVHCHIRLPTNISEQIIDTESAKPLQNLGTNQIRMNGLGCLELPQVFKAHLKEEAKCISMGGGFPQRWCQHQKGPALLCF